MVSVTITDSDYPPKSAEPIKPQQEEVAFTIMADSKLVVPEKRPYLVSNKSKILLEAVDRMSGDGLNTNILITGKQGVGKSELVTQFAATRDRPLATLEIGNLSESSQILVLGQLDKFPYGFVIDRCPLHHI